MSDHQDKPNTENFIKSMNQIEDAFKGLSESQKKEALEQIWLEDEAEFEWWCWRQVRKGRGLDCSVGGAAKTEFKGFKCIKCDFVLVNPGEDLLSEESPLSTLADNLLDEMYKGSLDPRDPKTRHARRAKCPKCSGLCFQNSLPPTYSPIEEILAFIFRVKRVFSATK